MISLKRSKTVSITFARSWCMQRSKVVCDSLLLAAASGGIVLAFARDDLAKHHHAISVHEGNTGETLAILECVAHQGLLRLEAALRHLVRLKRVRILHLLAPSLLSHLPLELRDAA